MDDGLIKGQDGVSRCRWCGDDPEYRRYHDAEWGVPVMESARLFEKICLEGFQAGLSWLTILRKRENFRAAFAGFDYRKVAQFTDKHGESLLSDAGIVRHRGKIESTINNARRAIELEQEFGSLAAYFWKWEPKTPKNLHRRTYEELKSLSATPESTALSKDLKKRGWSFVGPTTVYAFMQAMGMVNDHLPGCHRFQEVERIRESFTRPE